MPISNPEQKQNISRARYETEIDLVTLINDPQWGLDRGSTHFLVLLDLAGQFDIIDHGILLNHLTRLVIGGSVLLHWL